MSLQESRIVNFEVSIKITNEDIQDIVTTALCGGIGYWACLDNSREEWNGYKSDICFDEYATQLLLNGKSLYFLDVEGDTDNVCELTLEKLYDGITKTIIRHNTKLLSDGNLNLDELDAELADVIFQYALFDELIYG